MDDFRDFKRFVADLHVPTSPELEVHQRGLPAID
jgi:hypothetical protein